MRSFLIRDILSGPGGQQASSQQQVTNGEPTSGLSAELQLQLQLQLNQNHTHHHNHLTHNQASSSFIEGNSLQVSRHHHQNSLAATQARFLAKLAEHQQQVQASKYYEQLQQHHQQLLNLNLNHLQLHQQLQQQQQLTSNTNNISSSSSSSTGNSSSVGSAGANAAASGNNNVNINNRKPLKTSSFAYDCASPISSISDMNDRGEADELDEDEDDDEADGEEDEEGEDEERGTDESRRCKSSAEDDEDEDDEEIEVEKVAGDQQELSSSTAKISSSSSSSSRHHSGRRLIKSEEHRVRADQTVEVDLELANHHHHHHHHHQQQQQQLLTKQTPFQMDSPLDALFQMTSSTFDALKRGEKRKDRDGDTHESTNFTSKQTSKKKRKSRTAFTNNQIYELERRFRMQKYLSPTDRDEIAMTLNLSNAQVITWFQINSTNQILSIQNRRAKLKRDLEEQKRDIETAQLLNIQKTFFESFQALSQMKPNK